MKIIHKVGSWQFLTSSVLNLWPEELKKNTPANVAPLHEKNQFRAWSPVGFYHAPTLSARNTVDIKALEHFVKSCPKSLSYEGFIASHLQKEAMNVQAMHDYQRNISIEKMKSLIVSTIDEIKSIELNQIINNKG